MTKKRFFIDKIDSNQYAVYDRLKIGYIKPLVYTDRTVGLNYTQGVCDLLNDCDEKMNEVYEKLIIGKGSSEIIDMIKFGDNLNGVAIKELFDRNKKLEEENERLRQMIKENVFGRYEEGSLADLEFKAIAYDDIVRLEISDESEPKVIVICKQGKKENVKSFCQMFIPLGVYYEIKEVS